MTHRADSSHTRSQTPRHSRIGGGYLQAPVRIEYRPGLPDSYPTRGEMMRLLEEVVASGARAWWYSCAAKGSYPLFPSRYLPSVPEAEEGLFEWFTDECHRRGIAIMSWEYLATSPLTTREHPDWRMQFLQPVEGAISGRPKRHVEVYGDQNPSPCFNSPYGELLMDYCVEVIEELGFDGIWFDGCFMGPANTWPGGRIGCCCPRCDERYHDETGEHIPALEDWSNPAFRRFLRWRQRFFAEYWRRLCEHVRAHSPTGLIGLNNFNRWPHPTGLGCPLNEVDFDGLSCAEISQQPWQAPLMLGYLRQVSGRYPPELWIHRTPPGPGASGAQMAYFGELCMTFGGFHSEGHSVSPGHNHVGIRQTVARLAPRAEFVGGEPVRFAGIVLSSDTKDFAFDGDDEPTWRSVHGMHNLLLDAHWPVEVILDNQLRADHLADLALVVLPDVRCLSDERASALERYVRRGGLLVTLGWSGLLDEIGRRRRRGALDDLLGISRRGDLLQMAPVIAPVGEWAAGLPSRIMLWPDTYPAATVETELPLPERWAEDTEVLARGIRPQDDPARDCVEESRAITARKVGRGRVLFIDRDLGGFYSRTPWRELRELLTAAIRQFVSPPYRVEAPAHVAVTLWRQPEREVIHILSRPQSIRRVIPAPDVNLDDVPPAGKVAIELPWRVRSACRPISHAPVALTTSPSGSRIETRVDETHDVVVLRSAAAGR